MTYCTDLVPIFEKLLLLSFHVSLLAESSCFSLTVSDKKSTISYYVIPKIDRRSKQIGPKRLAGSSHPFSLLTEYT